MFRAVDVTMPYATPLHADDYVSARAGYFATIDILLEAIAAMFIFIALRHAMLRFLRL